MSSLETGMDFDQIPTHPAGTPPRVSIWMITYNHQDSIGQAIDSLLMQKTQFPFEIVIGEDTSPDRTREVILAYQRKHPEIIRLLLWRKNAGMMLNCVRTLEACRGEYIAFCEGDDYWTDPEKLQRQVDLMDGNPQMALCHHEVDYVSYEGGQRVRLKAFPPESQRGPRQARHLIEENFIQTCSLMIRRSFIPELDAGFLTLNLGDWPLCYLAAENGDIGYIARNMADYRIHVNNQWNHKSEEFRYKATARMCFYLAERARIEQARIDWRKAGHRNVDSLFNGQVPLPVATGRFRNLVNEKWISPTAAFGLLVRYLKRRTKARCKEFLPG